MVTAEELVVEMRGEGIGETTDQIEGMEGQFEETADSVGESADEMDGFADKWKGAMGAVVAGLAVGAAGLLSQVPVLGEAFGGLLSIIDALTFQMDKVLRPVLQPLTNLFYDISNAIFQLEGPLGTVVGVIGTIAGFVGAAIGVLIPFKGVLGAISAVLGPIAAGITTVAGIIAGLNPIVLAVVAVVGTLIAAWVLFEDEIRAAIDFAISKLEDLWGWFEDIGGWVVGGLEDAFDWLTDAIDSPLEAIEGIWDVLTDIGSWATEAVEDAFNWLSEALSDPLGTVEEIWNTLQDMVGETFQTFLEIVMQLVDPITGPPGGAESAVGDFFTGAADFLNPTTSVGSGDTTSGLLGGGSNEVTVGNQTINLDGRRMTQDTGRYRYDETATRGRYG